MQILKTTGNRGVIFNLRRHLGGRSRGDEGVSGSLPYILKDDPTELASLASVSSVVRCSLVGLVRKEGVTGKGEEREGGGGRNNFEREVRIISASESGKKRTCRCSRLG